MWPKSDIRLTDNTNTTLSQFHMVLKLWAITLRGHAHVSSVDITINSYLALGFRVNFQNIQAGNLCLVLS